MRTPAKSSSVLPHVISAEKPLDLGRVNVAVEHGVCAEFGGREEETGAEHGHDVDDDNGQW